MPETFYAYNTGETDANLIPYIFTDKFINYLYKFTFKSNIKTLRALPSSSTTSAGTTTAGRNNKQIANDINSALNVLIAGKSNDYQEYLNQQAGVQNGGSPRVEATALSLLNALAAATRR